MSQITQKGATGPLALQANGSFQSSTDSNLATLVGTRFDLSDGREVILVGVGGTAIGAGGTSGYLCQDSPLVANHLGLTVTAVQAYSNNGDIPATVTVTLGATALAANAYQGGFLNVDSGFGMGQSLRIASHPSALSSATGVVITLEDAPNTALGPTNAGTSVVSLIPAHGSSVVINPTTPTNVPVGITLYPLSAANYGFLVSKGLANAVSDSTAPGVGAPIGASTATAGTIGKTSGTGTATIAGTNAILGYTAVAAASGAAHSVFVNM